MLQGHKNSGTLRLRRDNWEKKRGREREKRAIAQCKGKKKEEERRKGGISKPLRSLNASQPQFPEVPLLTTHHHAVISVAPSPQGGLFATGSGDQKARIWRYDNLSDLPPHFNLPRRKKACIPVISPFSASFPTTISNHLSPVPPMSSCSISPHGILRLFPTLPPIRSTLALTPTCDTASAPSRRRSSHSASPPASNRSSATSTSNTLAFPFSKGSDPFLAPSTRQFPISALRSTLHVPSTSGSVSHPFFHAGDHID